MRYDEAMWYAAGAVLLIAALIAVSNARDEAERRKVAAARDAFERERSKIGRQAALAKCAHAFVEFGQTGIPGVVTMTTKWCRVCGANLGPAKLRESIFGDRWE